MGDAGNAAAVATRLGALVVDRGVDAALDEARQAIRRILNVVSEPYIVQPGGDSVTVRAPSS